MRIIVSTWAAVAVLAVNSLVCHGQAKPSQPAPASEPEILPMMSREETARMKNLLFADVPLEEFTRYPLRFPMTRIPALEEAPERALAQAVKDIRQGRPAEAKKKLKQVLSMPNVETRVLLHTWSALRKLGERPPPDVAGNVQGVICELHNEAGVGTLAAYADGSVRWIGGQGKVMVLELGGSDPEINYLIIDLHRSAKRVVERTRAAARRRAGEPPFEHFRVSVLTYGGIHVVEVFGPTVTSENFVGPILYASGSLVGAILEFEKKHSTKNEPPPRGGR